jgi:hypothetical protein
MAKNISSHGSNSLKEHKMDLIERYIYAIGKSLPSKNKADIQSELRSILSDNLESRYGSNPSEEQVVSLLKEFGAPEVVAASYWPEGQYLIGPRLFPLFRLSAGISLTVFAIVQLAVAGIAVIFNQEALPGFDFIGNLFNSLMVAFGIIVLVFAVLQRFDVRPSLEKEGWNPRDLPVVEPSADIKRSEIIAELVFEVIFAAILIALPGQLGAVLYPGSESFSINPPLQVYIPWIIVSLLLGIGLDFILLWRGRWETGSRIARIVIDLFGLGVLFLLIKSHNEWLAAQGVTSFFSAFSGLGEGIPSQETVQILVVNGFRIGFIIAAIVSIIELVKHVIGLVRQIWQPQSM